MQIKLQIATFFCGAAQIFSLSPFQVAAIVSEILETQPFPAFGGLFHSCLIVQY